MGEAPCCEKRFGMKPSDRASGHAGRSLHLTFSPPIGIRHVLLGEPKKNSDLKAVDRSEALRSKG